MLTVILGPSGSGKTRWLIEQANNELSSGNGNIAFIDSDDSHIFSLDHAVRLINAKEYNISTINSLYGFLAGIVSRDFDLQKIYVDGIYSIIDLNTDLSELFSSLHDLSSKHQVDILIGLDLEKEDLPKDIELEIVELSEQN